MGAWKRPGNCQIIDEDVLWSAFGPELIVYTRESRTPPSSPATARVLAGPAPCTAGRPTRLETALLSQSTGPSAIQGLGQQHP